MTAGEIGEELAAMGEAKFRAKQVFRWLHRGVTSFDGMSDISKPLRGKLEEPTKRVEVFEARNCVHLIQPERDECDQILQWSSQVHPWVA